jgi:flagellar basal-body rod protein FlgB
MFGNLDVLRLASGMAAHAEQRQVLIARNVANADTPGYRARDLQPFAQTYEDAAQAVPLRTTRPGHLAGSENFFGWDTVDAPDGESPDGNAVSLEDQMVKSAEVRQSHEMALAVYSNALGILRTAIGKR